MTNNLRQKPVGILGSKYKPLDNQFQIREALEKLCFVISKMEDGFSKALLLIAGISYILPYTRVGAVHAKVGHNIINAHIVISGQRVTAACTIGCN